MSCCQPLIIQSFSCLPFFWTRKKRARTHQRVLLVLKLLCTCFFSSSLCARVHKCLTSTHPHQTLHQPLCCQPGGQHQRASSCGHEEPGDKSGPAEAAGKPSGHGESGEGGGSAEQGRLGEQGEPGERCTVCFGERCRSIKAGRRWSWRACKAWGAGRGFIKRGWRWSWRWISAPESLMEEKSRIKKGKGGKLRYTELQSHLAEKPASCHANNPDPQWGLSTADN